MVGHGQQQRKPAACGRWQWHGQSAAATVERAETLLSWRDNRLSANGDTQARRVLFIQGLTDHFALSYDGLNRLKSIAGPVSESFALDGASNVTSRSGTAETYDNANRLTADGGTAHTWSDADRLAQRGADTFGYDALDRMTSSTVGGTARTYTYNGDGLLQTRTGGGVGASFLWDPSSLPARELKQGSDHIVYGLGPLYVVKADATTVTFTRDGSKNVRAELNAAGAVTAAFRYRAYGQLAQTTNGAPTREPQPFSDPSGAFCIPCLALIPIAWTAIQAALTTADIVSTAETLSDPNASSFDKATSVGLTAVGLVDPFGGGYSTAANMARKLTSHADEGARAGAELIQSVRAHGRTVDFAVDGSEELRYLDAVGAEASAGGTGHLHILLREDPSKAAVSPRSCDGTASC